MQLRYLASRSLKTGAAAPASEPPPVEETRSEERRIEPESSLPAQPPLEIPLVVSNRPAGELKSATPPIVEQARRCPLLPTRVTPDPRKILNSIGETVYDWDLRSDAISWGPNAAVVLGFGNLDAISTGRAFAECLSHDSESSRYEAIGRATDRGCG